MLGVIAKMIKPIPNLSMIIARDLNGNIGKGNKIPWDCKNDMQWFKKVTGDKGLIVGRKTFEGLPKVVRDRVALVLTNSRELNYFTGNNSEFYLNLNQSIAFVEGFCDESEMIVIGGAQIYKEFMPYVSKIYLSTIATVIDDADTNFLDFAGDWKVTESVAHDDCVLSTLIRKQPLI